MLNATGSPVDPSYVLAAQISPTLLFALVGGVLADRISPQAVLIGSNLAIMAGEGGFGLLVLTTHPALWATIALEVLTGTGTDGRRVRADFDATRYPNDTFGTC